MSEAVEVPHADTPNLSAIGAPPRVLALLTQELRTQGPTQQRMNLLTVLEHFDEVLAAHAETHDVEDFLLVLFTLVRKDTNLTSVPFTVLVAFFSGQNPLTPQLLTALRKIAAVAPPRTLSLEICLTDDNRRASAIDLLRTWDNSGIPCQVFVDDPLTLHLYLPIQRTAKAKVYRDFAFCTQRPKLTKNWNPTSFIHIKTNIKEKSEIMYRILVEGYNYGVNSIIAADICGYTNRKWDKLGNMELYGWPEGWDLHSFTEYAPGATITQYFSTDGYVTVKLASASFFCAGFSVSAWLVCHGYGEGFPITAEIFHQNDDL